MALVFDRQLMRPGDSLLRIFEEIGTVEFLLAILSPSSVTSSWVIKELEGAVIREIEDPGSRLSLSSRSDASCPQLSDRPYAANTKPDLILGSMTRLQERSYGSFRAR